MIHLHQLTGNRVRRAFRRELTFNKLKPVWLIAGLSVFGVRALLARHDRAVRIGTELGRLGVEQSG